MQTDFRSVYGSVLQDWLGVAPAGILGGSFPTLPLFAAATTPPAPTPTPAPTPPPGAKVQVQTSRGAAGRLNVAVTGRGIPIQAIRFGTAVNALVEIGGAAARAGGFVHTPSAPVMQQAFTVVRASAGAGSTVPFTLVDSGGSWETFVGGGPDAF
jgi:hypothetical protein